MEDTDFEIENYKSDRESNKWVIYILIGALAWALFFNKQKHEGQTAEEWFNLYDDAESRYEELKNCVENYAYSNNYQDLASIKNNCF